MWVSSWLFAVIVLCDFWVCGLQVLVLIVLFWSFGFVGFAVLVLIHWCLCSDYCDGCVTALYCEWICVVLNSDLLFD